MTRVALPEELEPITFEQRSVRLNGVAAGPVNGPPVVLLHGFPEFWYGWWRQIPRLAAAGFRVIVPDQRGYNQSDKPHGICSYAMKHLVADVIGIADQLGCGQLYLAGHDWGAAVAWSVAMQYPERVKKLAILNVPHPAAMMRFVRSNPRQLLRSWYMFFFQTPRVPEALFRANNFRLGTRSLVESSRPGTFSSEDLQRYRDAWAVPGALTGMINWYRALFRVRPDPAVANLQVKVPTRILWGLRDRFIVPELARESLRYCDEGGLIEFPEATHWVQHEEPERVSDLLIEFFR